MIFPNLKTDITLKDYRMVTGRSEYEDILQCNNEPSSMTERGHQFPAAFLIRTSGLDKVFFTLFCSWYTVVRMKQGGMKISRM